MSSMETTIVIISLIAAALGSLVLLTSLASHREELVHAYNMQQKTHEQNDNSAPVPGDKSDMDVVTNVS